MVASQKPDIGGAGSNARAPGDSLTLETFDPKIVDWHYPEAEAGECADLTIPVVIEIDGGMVSLEVDGSEQRCAAGGDAFGWRVEAILAHPQPMVVLEREFDEWGLLVYAGVCGVAAQVRKAVGRLETISEPPLRLPKNYAGRLLEAKPDVLGDKVLADGTDPTYEKVVGFLPPCHAYTFIGTPESERKYIVSPNGAIGRRPDQWNNEKQMETIDFDPAAVVGKIEPDQAKRGLLGGWLPAVNYGFYDSGIKRGWELCAFAVEDNGTKGLVRVRESDGKTRYFQLDPLETVDPETFHAGLLACQKQWTDRLGQGMKLDVPDARIMDVAQGCIARALSGCVGLHPKYGAGIYWEKQHDTFPPATLSLCACFLDWGLLDEARARLGYYFSHFIEEDGSIDYYGPAVAEYGQFLWLAAKCVRHTADMAWFDAHRSAMDRLCGWVLRERNANKARQQPDAPAYGLIWGSPEADTREDKDFYFSGDAWCWRGLVAVSELYAEIGKQRGDKTLAERAGALGAEAEAYHADIMAAAQRSIVRTGALPYFPPIVGHERPFDSMTQDRLASYTNYRYWLEALSAHCFGEEIDRMMIDYRVARGGELLGMTRFIDRLDNWPFYHYAEAILGYDRVREYLLGYFAHIAHHQTRGTFTAYEQAPIRGDRFRGYVADYCVPAELIAPMMTRWLLAQEEFDADALWLCRAVPRAWWAHGFNFTGASTRWGRVSLSAKSADSVQIRFDGKLPARVMLRVRHPKQAQLAAADTTGGACESVDAGRELIVLKPQAASVCVSVRFVG